MSYPFKINGYIYSKGTKAGFLRMQRQGIPRPLFSIEDRLAKLLSARYKALTRKLLKDIKTQCQSSDITLDAAPQDDIVSLLRFFEQSREFIERMNLGAIANTLQHIWFDEYEDKLPEFFIDKVGAVFKSEQKDYLKRLIGDADGHTAKILQSFSIDKQKFFNENLETVRTLYLDNSVQRIAGEEELIKRRILQRIVDYADGKSATLELADLIKEGYESSDHLARLFARDQMQRFNKACTLATFKSAAVTKVKWVTCGDVRVRDSHRALNGQIFDINNLPPEVDDYNCRCGLVPVEWADD